MCSRWWRASDGLSNRPERLHSNGNYNSRDRDGNDCEDRRPTRAVLRNSSLLSYCDLE